MLQAARRSDLDELSKQVDAMIRRLWHSHFQEFCPTDIWAPPVNLYRLPARLEVCVDLAGVDPRSVEVRIEPRALIIRGIRTAPEPQVSEREAMRIVAMEINHGPFSRTVSLPEHEQVDLLRIQTQYSRGLLWIRLPFREPA